MKVLLTSRGSVDGFARRRQVWPRRRPFLRRFGIRDEGGFNVLTKQVGMDPGALRSACRAWRTWIAWASSGPCRPPSGTTTVVPRTAPRLWRHRNPGGDRYPRSGTWCSTSSCAVREPARDHPLLGELDKKAIDTGAGLERLAFVMQDKPKLQRTDGEVSVIGAAMQDEWQALRFGCSRS